ncbi:MAG TPA: trimethylamine methyltransferase family protein [Acidimicrobiia bacterium]|nr:trimethylamine methyltransferase family protein [Acidimicrobiia bacterium]
MPREGSSRAERRAARGAGIHQLGWRNLRNPFRPLEVLADDEIEAIHLTSLRVLAELGMDFLHPEALAVLADGGAEVESGTQRVRFDPALVEETIASAPSSFRLHARNPQHDVDLGREHVTFATVGSAPNASDRERGRRPGTYDDFCNFLRLGQYFNAVHIFGGYPVEPVDLPPATRHLDCLQAFATLTDKVFHAYSLGRGRILDALEVTRIIRGLTSDELVNEPSLFTVVNTSSPLRLDGPMIEGLIEMARHRQVVVLTPFTLAGAMAPASLAGALALQNAEALASIVLHQLVQPGAPIMYGGFTSNVDMKSGAPAFGTPEYVKAAIAGGQLARRYHLPYRSSNANAANTVDAQAAYESQMSLWGALMGGAHMIMHGAGWMEGGLVASYEKFIVDVEMLQMMGEVFQPLTVNEEELAFEAVAEVGPGGHFFGAAHTLQRYESAFYPPLLSDWRNFENWQMAGAEPSDVRATRIWQQALSDYQPPPLADDRAAELEEFISRRKAEGGVGSGA